MCIATTGQQSVNFLEIFVNFSVTSDLPFFLCPLTDKSQTGESHLLLEHKQVVEELNRDLQERDDRIDEVTLEYEAKLKVTFCI